MAHRKTFAASLAQLPTKIWQFIRKSRDELKKVSWPTRETTTRFTIIVIVTSIAVGIVTGGIDFLLQQIVERIAF